MYPPKYTYQNKFTVLCITYQNGLESTEDINRGYKQQNILIRLKRKNIASTIYQNLGFIYSISYEK